MPGVSATSQTRRTRPCGRVPRVWAVEGAGRVSATFQIRRTRPCGRVLRIWVVEGGEKGAGVWKTIPDTKNATLWSRSSYLGGRGWWEGCKDIPDTKTRPWGRVLVSGVWKTIPDTKNATPDRVLRVRVVESNARGRGEGTLERAHKGTF